MLSTGTQLLLLDYLGDNGKGVIEVDDDPVVVFADFSGTQISKNTGMIMSKVGDNVTLAKKPGGDYYESGAVFSPVIDAGAKTQWSHIRWFSRNVGYFERETPNGTHVEIWLRVSNSDRTVRGILAGAEWMGPYTSAELDVTGRYVQYMVVLYTEDAAKTPSVGSVVLTPAFGETIDNGEFNLAQHFWERKRTRVEKLESGCPGRAVERCHRAYSSVRRVKMRHGGELLRNDTEAPRMGTAELVPKYLVSSDAGTRVRLELDPDEQSLENRGLAGRTSTLEEAPAVSDLYLENTRSLEAEEVKGRKVFVFSPKNPLADVYRNTAFKYGGSHRYRKWSFLFFPGASEVIVYPEVVDWFRDAEVNVGVQFWFHQRVSGWNGSEKDSYRRLFSSKLRWSPMSTHQPVRVTSWELKDRFEDDVLEDPSLVLQDDVWKVDDDVRFDFTFTGMNDPENFLREVRSMGENLLPMVSGENAGRFENVAEEALRNENVEEKLAEWGVSAGSVDIEAERRSLMALMEMDNRMMQMILDGWTLENAGPQTISGRGEAIENIDYRIGGYYAVTEEVNPPDGAGRGIRRTETARLPFDPDETANFDINVTGEGLVAGVKDDSPHLATVEIYAPSRAGGVTKAALYDSENDVVVEGDFAAGAFGWLPRFTSALRSGNPGKVTEGGGESETETLSFAKHENSPTRLRIRMTNEWGATVEQRLRVSPGGKIVSWDGGFDYRWLILAALVVVAWTSFVRWWKEKRGKG